MSGAAPDTHDPERWEFNYFNYFTEVEEHFQRVRGTGLFLLSPLDWALIETWKNAEIPLTAVLRGIDSAFEKWRVQKSRKRRMINSLAYCAQAVMEEARIMAGAVDRRPAKAEAPFSMEELRAYLAAGAAAIRGRGAAFESVAGAIGAILADLETHHDNLEDLEQRLTALEEKMVAIARTASSEEDLFAARREMERHLKPYRGKMTADQLLMLEKQYLDRTLLEQAGLPRLSLFYLR